MLTYELFLKNRGYVDEFTDNAVPIKKIFIRKSPDILLKLDEKTLDHYGVEKESEFKSFQERLTMPLSNKGSLGLPRRSTSPNSPKPYVILKGLYKEGVVSLLVGKKDKKKGGNAYYGYKCDLKEGEANVDLQGEVIIKLDQSRYRLPSQALFSAYREAGIIDERLVLDPNIFKAVCDAFIKYCRERGLPEEDIAAKQVRFEIVILPYIMTEPGNETVEYVSDDSSESADEVFVDAFGNESTGYPTGTTQTASFMSADDKAFSINCTQGREFYRNLGIGRESLPKINLPPDSECDVPGANELRWYFFSTNADADFEFKDQKSGFYDQLLHNYGELRSSAGASTVEKAAMKVLGIRKTQKKTEILIDQNLTIDQLQRILLLDKSEKCVRHPLVLESLIVKRKSGSKITVLWGPYIQAIQCLLSERPMDRELLMRQMVQTIREPVIKFAKSRDDNQRKEIFSKLDRFSFCLDLLTIKGKGGSCMNQNEEFAYRIGKVAGKYLKYKRKVDEITNSTHDILTYSKYDRETLRFVFKRISNSVFLSKASDADKTDIEAALKQERPTAEIEDSKAFDDYSYFFYKGVFETL